MAEIPMRLVISGRGNAGMIKQARSVTVRVLGVELKRRGFAKTGFRRL
ncbi:hypothetical protein KCP77_04640 [Salmonella enterica subsp. enterica]|nr:hypothetical protein KCP77_04640 [Salmonella enterica subsp. enterica]